MCYTGEIKCLIFGAVKITPLIVMQLGSGMNALSSFLDAYCFVPFGTL